MERGLLYFRPREECIVNDMVSGVGLSQSRSQLKHELPKKYIEAGSYISYLFANYRISRKTRLIFFDSPYFNKLADRYPKESISNLSRKEYLGFFLEFFSLTKENSKANTRIAFLNADWPMPRRAGLSGRIRDGREPSTKYLY